MKTIQETQKETSKHFTQAIKKAGLAELHALENKIDRHYNNGTLTVSSYSRLTTRIMAEVAKFECV